MKRSLRLAVALFTIFLFLAALSTCKGKHIVDRDWEKNKIRKNLTTQELVEEMGIGINLGNTFDATGDWINGSHITDYTKAWGSPVPTEEMIAGYAKAGFKSLRIPITWVNMISSSNVINGDLLDIVENVVNWTIDNGMVALINTHHDSDWIRKLSNPDDYDWVMERFAAIWTQVSGRFKDYGDRLIFESMNEITFDDVWRHGGNPFKKIKAFDLNNELNQVFVDIVRSSGGNNAKRHLLINVYSTGVEYAYDMYFKMPKDPAGRMAASVHYYTPAVFAILGEDASWGKARDTWGTPDDFKELNDQMDKLKVNCVDKGLPVIIGEFAACGDNKTQEMKRLWVVSVAEAVYSRGMCPMLWDTPGDQYDRQLFEFKDPLLIEQLMAIPIKYQR